MLLRFCAAAALLTAVAPAQKATLSDVAVAYMLFEEAFDGPIADEDFARINQEFDRASMAFLGGGMGATLEGLTRLRLERLGLKGEDLTRGLQLSSLRVVLTDHHRLEPPFVYLELLRSAEFEDAIARRVNVVALAGEQEVTRGACSLREPADGGVERTSVDWAKALPEASSLRFAVVQTLADGSEVLHSFARWSRVPADAYTSLTSRVADVEAPKLAEARRLFLDRAALLKGEGKGSKLNLLVRDAGELYAELEAESRALVEGRDPYHARPGDHWRTFAHGSQRLPLRVITPDPLKKDPMPLVIALHGAGGDECYFADGVEGGLLKRLARERGFVLAVPRTPDLMFQFEAFDALLAELIRCYSIDPERVYVLGHSMGAMTTATLTRIRPKALAGAVCIAGAGRLGDQVPTLVISGSEDPIVPAARTRGAAEAAREAGAPVQYVEYEGGGHTLILGRALRLALDFFEL